MMRSMLVPRLLLPILFSTAPAVASACREINLAKDSNSSVRYQPVEDQGSTSLCYAYAAAFLVNTYLMDTAQYSSPLVHPIEAALINRKDARNELYDFDSLGGGFIAPALSALRLRRNVCGRSQTDARIGRLVEAGGFESVRDAVTFLERNNLDQQLSKIRNQRFCSRNSQAEHWLELRLIAKKSQTDAVESLLKTCSKRTIELPKIATANRYSDKDFENAITTSLTRHRPVGLETSCSNKFFTQGFRGSGVDIRKTESGVVRESRAECAYEKHATVIIGQKTIAGRCHFLVRNSYHPNERDPHAAGCSCRNAITGETLDDCASLRGNQKYIGCWYKSDDLTKVSINAFAFQ